MILHASEKTPVIHYSKAKGRGSVSVGRQVGAHGISYSNAIAAGDALRRQIVRNEEIMAQHGICKTLFWCGRQVPAEWQSLPRPEISKLMMEQPDYRRANERRDSLPGESR